jgi:iron complex outermembrane receptor protein
MRRVPSHLSIAGAMVVLACLAGPRDALAAEAAAEGPKLEEVVVTAQRREQNLQEVGTSITAFDAKQIEEFGVKDVTEIASQVPGLQYNQYGATVTIYNLRGVSQNDFSDHQEAPVAVYSDDAYIASTGALAGSMFDLQRVEVLRGPQGTLFGRNSTGGLIHYLSNRPTDKPEAYLSVTGGNYNTLLTEGAINGPLSERVAARFSFSTAYHEGYITNRIGHSINDQNQYAARLQFRIQPSDAGEIYIKLHAVNNAHETAGNYSFATSIPDETGRGVFAPPGTGEPINGYYNPSNDVFNQAEDRRGIFNRTAWGANVHVTWNYEHFTLTSVTDYLRLQKRYGEDSDVSPNFVFNYDTFQHYQQFSQEFRLNGSTPSMRWIAGLYYINYRAEDRGITDLIQPYGLGDAQFTLRTSSPALFGQLEYDLNSRWTAIAGARYTRDDKKFDDLYYCETCPAEFQNLHYVAPAYPSASKNFDIFTGKLELDYKPTQDLLLYGSVNRGAKGGGWSAPTAGPILDPETLPYDQETLTNYEVGWKSTFWNGAARLNGAAFYYDYKNYQGFFLNVATQVVENIDAEVKGAELELAVVPLRGLDLQLGLSYLDTKAFDVPTPLASFVPPDTPGAYITAELPQAPRFSVNALARYQWPALGGTLSIAADAKWNDKQYLELVNAAVDLESAYAVANAILGYRSGNAAWDVSAYVKNLTDERYRIYNLDLAAFIGINQAVYGTPRLYGASVAYHWGR